MRLVIGRYLLLLVCVCVSFLPVYGQPEAVDTTEMSAIGKRTKADGLFYDAIMAKMRGDTAMARDYYEQYSLKRPEVSATFFELSRLYYSNRNSEKAEANIKKAIKLDETNKWYKEQYATILADRNDNEGAAKMMAELCVVEPDDKMYPLRAADYYERAKKYNEAITYLDKALKLNGGTDDELMMHKVQVYMELKDNEKAIGVIKQMIANDPKNGQLYKALAEIYDTDKQPAKALEVLNDAQKVIPDDAYVQIGLAVHYNKVGDTTQYKAFVKKVVLNKDLDAEAQIGFLNAYIPTLANDAAAKAQAMPMVQQLVAMHPDDTNVIAYYGDLLQYFGEHDSAVVVFKKVLAMKPRDYSRWEKLLSEYRGRQDADSLIKYSEKAMRLFPVKAIIWYFNAIGHSNKNEFPAAIKSMKKAIELQPESDTEMLGNMYGELGSIYHASKQDDLSDQTFDKALKIIPNDPTLLNNYSYFLSERGKRLDDAAKMSQRSLDLMPGQATFLDTYGWIMYQKGDYQKAKEYIEKAIQMAGLAADATLYDHLGNIYFKLNNIVKAVENWKKSKEKGNDNPNIDKKISEEKLYE